MIDRIPLFELRFGITGTQHNAPVCRRKHDKLGLNPLNRGFTDILDKGHRNTATFRCGSDLHIRVIHIECRNIGLQAAVKRCGFQPYFVVFDRFRIELDGIGGTIAILVRCPSRYPARMIAFTVGGVDIVFCMFR